MEPSKKSPQMEKFLNDFTMEHFGRSRTECIKNSICVFCGGEAKSFRDMKSTREFSVSGLCQTCQIEVFGG